MEIAHNVESTPCRGECTMQGASSAFDCKLKLGLSRTFQQSSSSSQFRDPESSVPPLPVGGLSDQLSSEEEAVYKGSPVS